MSGRGLPAVLLPTVTAVQAVDEENIEEGVVRVELPPANKFEFAWPTETPPTVPLPLTAERPAGVSLSSSEGETDVSEEESSPPTRRDALAGEGDDSEFVTPTNNMDSDQNPLEQAEHLPPLPRLSRVLSMPVPSQLGYLRNPRRLPSSPSSDSPIAIELPPEYAHFHEFSLELADSVQMMIQTLLQLSPPQVLDPAKEQFSACSLSIPTPSISAMFTSMKNLNYMSANMSTLSLDTHVQQVASPVDLAGMPVVHNDFDVGEMLQSVGDALSGMAAQAGVDLVLFHGDLGMKHVPVRGDESGISYTLSHVIRQLMGVAHPGDTIEMGLFIEKPTHTSDSASSDTPRQDSTGQSSPIHEHTGPLRCTFHLMHRYASAHSTRSGAGTSEDGSVPNSPPSFRTSPSFKTLILRRLLRHVGASLEEDVPPRSFSAGKTYALTVQFERGSPSVVDPAVGASLEDTVYQGFPDFKISHEPTLEQLSQFAESLKGRKVTLFAHSKGSFAQHLTSYLTAWGLDVTHVSTEPGADTLPEHVEQVPEPTSSPTASREELPSAYLDQSSAPSPSTSRPAVADALSFCLIDDDVAVLRSRLQKARAEQAYPLHLNTRKRPSLANNHRPRSSPQVARVMGLTPSTSALFAPPPVIVHFTSLANFKLVKDVIQSILMPGAGNASRVPEVIVIPKPAGPRRVLTALHTAITKPIVDPFFYPTATSPISPGFPAITPFFNVSGPAKSPGARSATSVRTASDKSARSPKEHTPSSPRGVSETMEYFSDAAARLGASPASGLVIQSPDGQPAGIFFHPKAKGGGRSERTTTPQSERTGTPSDHPGRSRGVSFRRTADEVKSGSSTPEIATTPRRRAAAGTDGDAGADVQPVEGAPPKGKGRLAPHRGESLVTLGPAGSPAGESPAAAGPPLAPPRKPTQPDPLVRHPSDPPPPTSPSRPSPQPGRRLRRPNMDGPSASAPSTLQKKGKPSDTNIVPPISVLIVDDNPINQTILSTFMTKRRIKYDVAKNGEEAVAKWQTGGFHLILMDIQMPVMDGIEATKEIRRMEKYNVLGGFPSTPQSEGQRTPSEASATESRSSTMSTPPYRSSVIIVALTASSLPSDRVAALAAGCNDFLTKPVSLQWLNSKIIEWGSIKALQMWADIRPDVVKSISSGQAVQAQNVARRLHVPEGRLTPTGSRSRSSSIAHRVPFADGAGALARSLLAEKSATPSPPVQDSDESPGAFSNTSGGSEAVPTVVAQDSHDLEVGHAVNGGAPDSAEAPPATDSFFPPAADASAPPDAPKIDSQPGAADAPPATLSFFPPAADASDPVQAPKNDSQPGAQANSSGLSADLAAADVPELKDAAEAADSPTAPSSDERPPAPPPPPEPQ